jgi:hypothetical protein
VYAEGELKDLVESVGGAEVLEQYYDTGNWCIVVQKQLPAGQEAGRESGIMTKAARLS